MNTQTYDLLELEHITGFSGKHQKTIISHPSKPNIFLYCIGGLVVIENVDDKHDQKFLRGHDMAVTALAISVSGNYCY
jgi:hypothetical protein